MMSRSVRAYCEATDELEAFILNNLGCKRDCRENLRYK